MWGVKDAPKQGTCAVLYKVPRTGCKDRLGLAIGIRPQNRCVSKNCPACTMAILGVVNAS